MELNNKKLFEIIGIKEVTRLLLEEENINLKDRIKKLEEEKNTIQKTLKKQVEDV